MINVKDFKLDTMQTGGDDLKEVYVPNEEVPQLGAIEDMIATQSIRMSVKDRNDLRKSKE